MKGMIIVSIVLGLIFTLSVSLIIYNSYDEYNTIQRNINKYILDKDCEFKQLENGWTQMSSCSLLKINETMFEKARRVG